MAGGLAIILLLVALSAACGDFEPEPLGPPGPPPLPPPPAITVPGGFAVEIFASGLALPTSLAFAPDGSDRLFVNELQTGKIRIIEGGRLLDESFAEVTTNTTGDFPVGGENGLLGITFGPEYIDNRHVYVTYATRSDTGTFGTVLRLTDVDGRGQDPMVLLEGVPGAPGHQIESLTFGPDGTLYVSVGDAFMEADVQDPDTFLGKILRLNPDGSRPADNPFPDSYTYAYGFRNAFDLVFDETARLFSTDNGPASSDELNHVLPGGNYGWPIGLGVTSDPALIAPLHVWPEIVSPVGMAMYTADRFPTAYRGKLLLVLFGDTFSEGPSDRAKRVQVVDLNASPPTFEDFAVYGFPGLGNPLDITVGPDGSVFLSDIFQGRIYRISYQG